MAPARAGPIARLTFMPTLFHEMAAGSALLETSDTTVAVQITANALYVNGAHTGFTRSELIVTLG